MAKKAKIIDNLTSIREAQECKCGTHSNVNLIINFGFNPREEGQPKGVTIYQVMCRHCRQETAWFTNDNQAIKSWNANNKQSN